MLSGEQQMHLFSRHFLKPQRDEDLKSCLATTTKREVLAPTMSGQFACVVLVHWVKHLKLVCSGGKLSFPPKIAHTWGGSDWVISNTVFKR